MNDFIEIAVTLDRSPEETWALITDPESLGAWMGGSFEIAFEPGAPFVFRTEGRIQRGEIQELVRAERLTWIWSDGPEESEVVIELAGDDGSTTVWVTERLLPPREWSRPSIPPIEASLV